MRAAGRSKQVTSRYRRELDSLALTYEIARRHDVAELARVLERVASRPLVVVGSGGSFSVATYCAALHRRATGQIGRAMTPLLLAGGADSLDAALLCVSASGSNVDIKAALSAGVRSEMRPAIVFALEDGSPLAALATAAGYPDTVTGPRPPVPDGFLAVNSVLATCTTFALAYREVAGQASAFATTLDDMLERTGARPYEVSEKIADLKGARTISVLFSPELEAAAVDLESRFVEAALGHVHIADFRNFGHGRHNWIDKRGNSTVLLSLAEARYASLAERTLKLLPAEVTSIEAQFCGEADEVGLAGLIVALHTAAGAGDAIGVDPGRPGVPEFGRKLYRLSAPEIRPESNPALARKRAAIERLGGSLSLAELEDARKRCLRRIEETTIKAVVLDYDGTLVDFRRRYDALPDEVGTALRRLIESGIAIGVATGRGKSVGERLREGMPRPLWERIWVGYYNGAECALLSENAAPIGREPSGLSAQVAELLGRDADRWIVDARRMQVTVTPKRRAQTSALMAEVAARLAVGGQSLRIVTSSHSIDVLCGAFSKVDLVRSLSRATETSPDAILRIGDRGAAPGNDYDLLRHPLGLSVDEVSADIDSCWRWTVSGCLGPNATMRILSALGSSNGVARLHMTDLCKG